MKTAERLRKVRAAFHISQRELAERVGVSPQLISSLESGRAGLTMTMAKAIEAELGVSAKWLLEGIGEMLPERKELSRELTSILNYYPAVVEVANSLARYMSLSSWQSLNEICMRMIQQEPEKYAETNEP